ncbi:MAG: SDR family NAD(P)-dependent oxidoreductase [Halioglobus sp.]
MLGLIGDGPALWYQGYPTITITGLFTSRFTGQDRGHHGRKPAFDGRAMGELFLAKGMNVVLGDIEQQALDATVAELNATGDRCIGVVTDVSKAQDMQRLADAALAKFGAIHIACNNAGVFAGGLLWEESLADYQWQMDVNIWGVIHGIRTFIPIMAAQDSDCHMVNTASMAAVTAMPYSGIYHMTKHAVLALSESLYHELAFHVPNVGSSCCARRQSIPASPPRNLQSPGSYRREGDIVEVRRAHAGLAERWPTVSPSAWASES